MGRWARGDELACGGKPAMSGGCRNLAEWVIIPEGQQWPRNLPICNLHLSSSLTLAQQHHPLVKFRVEPFQDASEVPARRNKRPRRSQTG